MAATRPAVLVYQEFATLTTGVATPELNCMIAGPAYWIKDFLDDRATNVDPNDPASIAQGKRFAELKAVLESQLTDLKVYRFGTISISTFIVGRTSTGELAGLLTGQVET